MRRVPFRVFSAVTVASTNSAESEVIDCTNGLPVSLVIQLTSATADPDVKLQVATSADGTTFGSYDDFAEIIASSLGAFGTSVQLPHTITFAETSFPRAPFLQFKLTGINSNPSDTIATVTLYVEE